VKHFVIFFEEKEGSTAVVQSLDILPLVSVVRRETEGNRGGWEPFEWFNCGSLGPDRFRACLRMIFGKRPLDLSLLNGLYTRTAKAPLRPFDTSGSVGFKMRISAPWDIPNLTAASPYRRRRTVHYLAKALRRVNRGAFRSLMMQELAELDVVAFIMVRQDIFRWAISKYHGDGTGRPGHLQFRLATSGPDSPEVPRIRIDPDRFGRVVDKCVRIHGVKRWWAESLESAGIPVHALRYEDFLADRVEFFAGMLDKIDAVMDRRVLRDHLDEGIPLRRVHGADISEYITNHEEITGLYGNRFIQWP
jgi:hypothetical protein